MELNPVTNFDELKLESTRYIEKIFEMNVAPQAPKKTDFRFYQYGFMLFWDWFFGYIENISA